MRVEHLGAVSRVKKNEGVLHAFLLSLSGDLEAIRNTSKKVALVGGVGKEYFEAEALLGHQGISVDVYADSSFSMNGKYFGGIPVQSTYDLLKEPDSYYYVIVGPKESPANRINDVLVQLRAHNIPDMSISVFFENPFHDFADEDPDLKANIMDAVNAIGFEDMPAGRLSTLSTASGEYSLTRIGTFIPLIYSTRWSHYAYVWESEYVRKKENSKILEIGPGEGLMSLVLLNRFAKINIDWLLFADQPFELNGAIKNVKTKYPNRISELFGKIEKNDFLLPENTYDMVIMTEVMEHFALNPIPTMKKIQKSIRNDGHMFLSTPNWGHLHIYKSWKDMPGCNDINDEDYMNLLYGHVYQYSRPELEEIFAESGFIVERYAESESNNHNFLLKKNPNFS